jgi:hypothetical protein
MSKQIAHLFESGKFQSVVFSLQAFHKGLRQAVQSVLYRRASFSKTVSSSVTLAKYRLISGVKLPDGGFTPSIISVLTCRP